jgi:hypothetical protein
MIDLITIFQKSVDRRDWTEKPRLTIVLASCSFSDFALGSAGAIPHRRDVWNLPGYEISRLRRHNKQEKKKNTEKDKINEKNTQKAIATFSGEIAQAAVAIRSLRI